MTSGVAHSVQTRLVRHAHAIEADPNLVLARYATERLLYRLSQSVHADRFVLKGAMLLVVWVGETIRATRDADLMGFNLLTGDDLAAVFRDVCMVPVQPDGLRYEVESIEVQAIRREDAYGGQRVTMLTYLGPARLRVQVDVGLGDAIVPEPEWIEYPSLLDQPRPRLRAYRPETSIAEKLHAMVVLGSKNSRMRDFFDISLLADSCSFESAVLIEAVSATFGRRRTACPTTLPLALTRRFAEIDGKQAQWAGFIRRNRLAHSAVELEAAIDRIAVFAGPILTAAGTKMSFSADWPPGGPWVDR